MSFGDYWLALQAKNPGLKDSSTKMTITVESFRKALEQAFDKGFEQAKHNQSIFESLFGKM